MNMKAMLVAGLIAVVAVAIAMRVEAIRKPLGLPVPVTA